MHEMALCESIVEIIEREAERQSFSRVRTVWLELGALSHAEPEALRFCFDAVTRDTLAAGATLEIVPVEGAAWCLDCAKSVVIAARGEACPSCGGYRLQVTAGEEMRLKELEVD
jgi:hydrogenase nickel incorporation protein HypA/HybF